VSCGTYHDGFALTNSSCSVGLLPPVGQDSYAAVSNLMAVTFPRSANDAMTIAMAGLVQASIDPATPLGSPVYASAGSLGSAEITFWSDGPVRPGILKSSFLGSFPGSPNGYQSDISLEVGRQQFICGSDIDFGCVDTQLVLDSRFDDRFHVTLGTPFTIEAADELFADAQAFNELDAHGTMNTLLGLRLYESDGVTPVMMHDAAPEPISLALCALGILGISGFRQFVRPRDH
jgi:hypothetical protein